MLQSTNFRPWILCMPRLLIVEDEAAIADTLVFALQRG